MSGILFETQCRNFFSSITARKRGIGSAHNIGGFFIPGSNFFHFGRCYTLIFSVALEDAPTTNYGVAKLIWYIEQNVCEILPKIMHLVFLGIVEAS